MILTTLKNGLKDVTASFIGRGIIGTALETVAGFGEALGTHGTDILRKTPLISNIDLGVRLADSITGTKAGKHIDTKHADLKQAVRDYNLVKRTTTLANQIYTPQTKAGEISANIGSVATSIAASLTLPTFLVSVGGQTGLATRNAYDKAIQRGDSEEAAEQAAAKAFPQVLAVYGASELAAGQIMKGVGSLAKIKYSGSKPMQKILNIFDTSPTARIIAAGQGEGITEALQEQAVRNITQEALEGDYFNPVAALHDLATNPEAQAEFLSNYIYGNIGGKGIRSIIEIADSTARPINEKIADKTANVIAEKNLIPQVTADLQVLSANEKAQTLSLATYAATISKNETIPEAAIYEALEKHGNTNDLSSVMEAILNEEKSIKHGDWGSVLLPTTDEIVMEMGQMEVVGETFETIKTERQEQQQFEQELTQAQEEQAAIEQEAIDNQQLGFAGRTEEGDVRLQRVADKLSSTVRRGDVEAIEQPDGTLVAPEAKVREALAGKPERTARIKELTRDIAKRAPLVQEQLDKGNIAFVEGLVDGIGRGKKQGDKLTFGEGADVGTILHEHWHLYYDKALTNEEKREVNRLIYKNNRDLLDQQMEILRKENPNRNEADIMNEAALEVGAVLAEQYGRANLQPKTFIERIFDKLKRMVQEILGVDTTLMDTYRQFTQEPIDTKLKEKQFFKEQAQEQEQFYDSGMRSKALEQLKSAPKIQDIDDLAYPTLLQRIQQSQAAETIEERLGYSTKFTEALRSKYGTADEAQGITKGYVRQLIKRGNVKGVEAEAAERAMDLFELDRMGAQQFAKAFADEMPEIGMRFVEESSYDTMSVDWGTAPFTNVVSFASKYIPEGNRLGIGHFSPYEAESDLSGDTLGFWRYVRDDYGEEKPYIIEVQSDWVKNAKALPDDVVGGKEEFSPGTFKIGDEVTSAAGTQGYIYEVSNPTYPYGNKNEQYRLISKEALEREGITFEQWLRAQEIRGSIEGEMSMETYNTMLNATVRYGEPIRSPLKEFILENNERILLSKIWEEAVQRGDGEVRLPAAETVGKVEGFGGGEGDGEWITEFDPDRYTGGELVTNHYMVRSDEYDYHGRVVGKSTYPDRRIAGYVVLHEDDVTEQQAKQIFTLLEKRQDDMAKMQQENPGRRPHWAVIETAIEKVTGKEFEYGNGEEGKGYWEFLSERIGMDEYNYDTLSQTQRNVVDRYEPGGKLYNTAKKMWGSPVKIEHNGDPFYEFTLPTNKPKALFQRIQDTHGYTTKLTRVLEAGKKQRYGVQELRELLKSATYWEGGALQKEEIELADSILDVWQEETGEKKVDIGAFLSKYQNITLPIDWYDTDQHANFGVENLGFERLNDRDGYMGTNTKVFTVGIGGRYGTAHFPTKKEFIDQPYIGDTSRNLKDLDPEVEAESVLGWYRSVGGGIKGEPIYITEIQSDLDFGEIENMRIKEKMFEKNWQNIIVSQAIQEAAAKDVKLYVAQPETVAKVEGFFPVSENLTDTFEEGRYEVGSFVIHTQEGETTQHGYIVGIVPASENTEKYLFVGEDLISEKEAETIAKRIENENVLTDFEKASEIVGEVVEGRKINVGGYLNYLVQGDPQFMSKFDMSKLKPEHQTVVKQYGKGGDTYQAMERMAGKKNIKEFKDEQGNWWWEIDTTTAKRVEGTLYQRDKKGARVMTGAQIEDMQMIAEWMRANNLPVDKENLTTEYSKYLLEARATEPTTFAGKEYYPIYISVGNDPAGEGENGLIAGFFAMDGSTITDLTIERYMKPNTVKYQVQGDMLIHKWNPAFTGKLMDTITNLLRQSGYNTITLADDIAPLTKRMIEHYYGQQGEIDLAEKPIFDTAKVELEPALYQRGERKSEIADTIEERLGYSTKFTEALRSKYGTAMEDRGITKGYIRQLIKRGNAKGVEAEAAERAMEHLPDDRMGAQDFAEAFAEEMPAFMADDVRSGKFDAASVDWGKPPEDLIVTFKSKYVPEDKQIGTQHFPAGYEGADTLGFARYTEDEDKNFYFEVQADWVDQARKLKGDVVGFQDFIQFEPKDLDEQEYKIGDKVESRRPGEEYGKIIIETGYIVGIEKPPYSEQLRQFVFTSESDLKAKNIDPKTIPTMTDEDRMSLPRMKFVPPIRSPLKQFLTEYDKRIILSKMAEKELKEGSTKVRIGSAKTVAGVEGFGGGEREVIYTFPVDTYSVGDFVTDTDEDGNTVHGYIVAVLPAADGVNEQYVFVEENEIDEKGAKTIAQKVQEEELTDPIDIDTLIKRELDKEQYNEISWLLSQPTDESSYDYADLTKTQKNVVDRYEPGGALYNTAKKMWGNPKKIEHKEDDFYEFSLPEEPPTTLFQRDTDKMAENEGITDEWLEKEGLVKRGGFKKRIFFDEDIKGSALKTAGAAVRSQDRRISAIDPITAGQLEAALGINKDQIFRELVQDEKLFPDLIKAYNKLSAKEKALVNIYTVRQDKASIEKAREILGSGELDKLLKVNERVHALLGRVGIKVNKLDFYLSRKITDDTKQKIKHQDPMRKFYSSGVTGHFKQRTRSAKDITAENINEYEPPLLYAQEFLQSVSRFIAGQAYFNEVNLFNTDGSLIKTKGSGGAGIVQRNKNGSVNLPATLENKWQARARELYAESFVTTQDGLGLVEEGGGEVYNYSFIDGQPVDSKKRPINAKRLDYAKEAYDNFVANKDEWIYLVGRLFAPKDASFIRTTKALSAVKLFGYGFTLAQPRIAFKASFENLSRTTVDAGVLNMAMGILDVWRGGRKVETKEGERVPFIPKQVKDWVLDREKIEQERGLKTEKGANVLFGGSGWQFFKQGAVEAQKHALYRDFRQLVKRAQAGDKSAETTLENKYRVNIVPKKMRDQAYKDVLEDKQNYFVNMFVMQGESRAEITSPLQRTGWGAHHALGSMLSMMKTDLMKQHDFNITRSVDPLIEAKKNYDKKTQELVNAELAAARKAGREPDFSKLNKRQLAKVGAYVHAVYNLGANFIHSGVLYGGLYSLDVLFRHLWRVMEGDDEEAEEELETTTLVTEALTRQFGIGGYEVNKFLRTKNLSDLFAPFTELAIGTTIFSGISKAADITKPEQIARQVPFIGDIFYHWFAPKNAETKEQFDSWSFDKEFDFNMEFEFEDFDW